MITLSSATSKNGEWDTPSVGKALEEFYYKALF